MSVAPDYTPSDLLVRIKLIPILEAAHMEGHLHAKLRGVGIFVGDKIFAYDSDLGRVKEIYREQRKATAVEDLRTRAHQNLDLNRNMHRDNEVIDCASLLNEEGSRSVKYGTVIEFQTGKRTHDEMASCHNDFNEPVTFYDNASQSNHIISRERSGSVNSAASGQSIGSASSVFRVKEGDRAAFVSGQYHTPVR